MKSPIVLLLALLKAYSRLEPDVVGLPKDLRTLRRRYKDEGYGFLSVALPALAKSLDEGLSCGELSVPRGFSRIPGGRIPRLFSGIFRKVFDNQGNLLDSPSIEAIKILREILMFWKKVPSNSVVEESLDHEARVRFLADDLTASRVILPEAFVWQLQRVRRFILPSLLSMQTTEMDPRHGPGAVFQRLSSNQKWEFIINQINGDLIDCERFGLECIQYSVRQSSGSIHDSASRLTDTLLRHSPSNSRGMVLDDDPVTSVARLCTVPKNSTSRRTITVEPAENMFLQQGLRSMLIKSMDKCMLLNRCVRLSDQSLNQILALKGSRTDEWATIDLKSASDLMSVELVKSVFGSHADFLSALLDTRSSHLEDPFRKGGREIPLAKYAGMGNATTFPVQTVVFATVAMAAICHARGVRPTKESLKHACDHLQVYGDDIIVHHRYARQVVVWLEMAGLTVNHSKSFLEGNFKESCGVDAYMGVDVTPLYIKTRPEQTSISPRDLEGLVQLSNSLWSRGLYEPSTCIVETCEKALGRRIPIGHPLSGNLCLHDRLQSTEVHRWNSRLHRFELRIPVLKSRTVRDKVDGYAALLKFFLVPLEGRGVGHLEKTDKRSSSRIAWRWVPTRLTA